MQTEGKKGQVEQGGVLALEIGLGADEIGLDEELPAGPAPLGDTRA
jgi:hypothetical protein